MRSCSRNAGGEHPGPTRGARIQYIHQLASQRTTRTQGLGSDAAALCAHAFYADTHEQADACVPSRAWSSGTLPLACSVRCVPLRPRLPHTRDACSRGLTPPHFSAGPSQRSRGSVAAFSALLPFYASPCSAASRRWRIALAPGFVRPLGCIASLPHARSTGPRGYSLSLKHKGRRRLQPTHTLQGRASSRRDSQSLGRQKGQSVTRAAEGTVSHEGGRASHGRS
jgi:hypothetical protein